MAKTHYDVLGLENGATHAEIRSAYRRLVLVHHPDHTSDPASKAIFLEAKQAYEVLSDPESRSRYDDHLAFQTKRADDEARARADKVRKEEESARLKAEREATRSGATIAQEVLRLQALYGRGRHNDAEKVAYEILQIAPRQPIPYAVLADIYRGRGQVNEASKMYAYAAQMDPANPVYQRRYEDLLNASRVVTDRRSTRLEAEDKRILAPAVGAGFVFLSCLYVGLSNEHMSLAGISFISSWTMGLVCNLFLSGVAVGAALAVGNWLDRFESMTASSSGRAGPTIVLGLVAMVNFWVSAVFYILIALGLKAFNYSTTRLMLAVAAVTLVLTFASYPANGIHPVQTLLWGGNLVYVGGVIGWMATDSMRP